MLIISLIKSIYPYLNDELEISTRLHKLIHTITVEHGLVIMLFFHSFTHTYKCRLPQIIYQHHTAICRKKNTAVRNLQNTGGQLKLKLI